MQPFMGRQPLTSGERLRWKLRGFTARQPFISFLLYVVVEEPYAPDNQT